MLLCLCLWSHEIVEALVANTIFTSTTEVQVEVYDNVICQQKLIL